MSNVECAYPRPIWVEKGAGRRLKRPVEGNGRDTPKCNAASNIRAHVRTYSPRWATLRSSRVRTCGASWPHCGQLWPHVWREVATLRSAVAAVRRKVATLRSTVTARAAQGGHIAVNRGRTCGASWPHCGQPWPHVRRKVATLRSTVTARAARAGHIAVNRGRTCGASWPHCGQPWPQCGASWPHCGHRGRTCGARWQRCGQPWPTCGASWQRCYPSCTHVCTHRGTLLHAGCARAPSSASLCWKGFSTRPDWILRIARRPAVDRQDEQLGVGRLRRIKTDRVGIRRHGL